MSEVHLDCRQTCHLRIAPNGLHCLWRNNSLSGGFKRSPSARAQKETPSVCVVPKRTSYGRGRLVAADFIDVEISPSHSLLPALCPKTGAEAIMYVKSCSRQLTSRTARLAGV